jgi:hypothetical protein
MELARGGVGCTGVPFGGSKCKGWKVDERLTRIPQREITDRGVQEPFAGGVQRAWLVRQSVSAGFASARYVLTEARPSVAAFHARGAERTLREKRHP